MLKLNDYSGFTKIPAAPLGIQIMTHPQYWKN
jgi:hypothetical protein